MLIAARQNTRSRCAPVHGRLSGARITPANGSAAQRGHDLLPREGEALLNGLTGPQSRVGSFESGQGGRFNQNVDVQVVWDQENPELTPGEYVGHVKLIGMVLPPADLGIGWAAAHATATTPTATCGRHN